MRAPPMSMLGVPLRMAGARRQSVIPGRKRNGVREARAAIRPGIRATRLGTPLAIQRGDPMNSVLFVSHDGDVREAGIRALERGGFDVTPAAHGGHPVLACVERGFDVLAIADALPHGPRPPI